MGSRNKNISHQNSTAAIFTAMVGSLGVLQKHKHLHINRRGWGGVAQAYYNVEYSHGG